MTLTTPMTMCQVTPCQSRIWKPWTIWTMPEMTRKMPMTSVKAMVEEIGSTIAARPPIM